MHILLLTREYLHEKLPNCGGTGVFMADLAKELVKKGHQVTVFGISSKKVTFLNENVTVNFIESVFKRNFILNLFRSITGKFSLLSKMHLSIHEYEKKDISLQLYKYVSENNIKIDIIETHDFDGLALFLTKKIPFIVRCHGSWTILEKYFNYKNVQKGRLYCEKEVFKKTENVITISKYSDKINKETFHLNNTKLIYNGIDTVYFNRNKIFQKIENSLFFVGNVSHEKGAEIAFNTFLNVAKEIPNTSLHFVGRTNLTLKKEFIERATQSQLQNSMHFHGFLPKESLLEFLNKAHVLLFPSKGETFGLALCEAMAIEKPVICSNIEAYNEIITSNENGLIAKDEHEYTNYCLAILKDEKLEVKLSKNARLSIIENFSKEKMIQETLSYYSTILKNKQN